jgi:hypothetical protein
MPIEDDPIFGNMLVCTPELGNIYDQHAVVVKDDLNNIIGHVPRHICRVISTCLNIHHILARADAIYTGGLIHEGQIQGGGVKLPCIYLLEFRDLEGL